MRTLVTFIATGGYVGYAPVMPGTFGALIGLPIGIFCSRVWTYWPAAFVGFFSILFVGACYVAGQAEILSSKHDDSQIVIDEVFGMVATMAWLPTGWLWLGVAFGLFRLFDIIKPWPASYFDKMAGGGGVMLDDLVAGIYANLVAHIIWRIATSGL